MIDGNFRFRVHFIGIGGVSMSALALFCVEKGMAVSGSDLAENETILSLKNKGVKVYIGHKIENVIGAELVVYTSAINYDNPELSYAIDNKIFTMSRADFLQKIISTFPSSLGICGCHGKTTASCMVAHILKYTNKTFTAHIGGYDNELGNFNYGKNFIITEVCEYKKNINKITTNFAICLNIDNDHMDCYKDKNEIAETYFSYLNRAKVKIINLDDEFLKNYKGENIISFGIDSDADFKAVNIKSSEGFYTFTLMNKGKIINNIKLSVCGRHNIYNALAAIAFSYAFNIPIKKAILGLKKFVGVKRRFECLGNICGYKVIADYCHHPFEISTTLKAAEESVGKYTVIFQPHTYSRTKLLMEDFIKTLSKVKNLYIYKTYPAREDYDKEGSAEYLAEKIKKCIYIKDEEQLFKMFKNKQIIGDNLLILGAGNLYDEIKKLRNN